MAHKNNTIVELLFENGAVIKLVVGGSTPQHEITETIDNEIRKGGVFVFSDRWANCEATMNGLFVSRINMAKVIGTLI